MRRWAPIVQHVAQTTGIELELTTGADIPSYQNEIKDGKFDFAYVNAYHYTLFHDSVGYDAFARQQGADTVGIIVVRKASPIKSVADLKGTTMAFPAPTAIAATVLQLSHLQSEKVDVRPTYMSTMDNVYSAVARGLYPAGGGEMRTFESMDSTMRNDLRILWSAKPIPAHPFFAHPRVPKEVVAKVQKAMVELSTTDSGKNLLRAVRFKGIEATSDSDYNEVRSLKLSIPKAQ
jgi:phosphonate transport system substrate-binding protein